MLVTIARTEHLNLLRLDRNEQLTRPRKIKWVLQDQAILRAQNQLCANPPQISIILFLIRMAHRCASFSPRRRNEETYVDDEDLTQLDENPTEQAEGKHLFNFLFHFLLVFFQLLGVSVPYELRP